MHNIYSDASSNENSRFKGSSGEIVGKTLENTGMAADESQKQKRGDRWSKEWGQKGTFCVVNGSLSSQEFGVRAKVSKIHRSSRTPRWHCERWFRITHSIHWAGIISITNDGCKRSWTSYPECQDVQDKQLTQCLLKSGKHGRCSIIVENAEVRMSRHLDSSTTTQIA